MADEPALGFKSSVQWTPRQKSSRSPSISSACDPIRVMMRMFRTTYTLSVSSTPTFENGEPSGPIT
ncbi:MAG TPA: hypothetical protein VMH37_00655 [Candidatus Binataceae bacterium]|nr:hypothetical protein [Candidatus Binataceae bacterium]